MLSVTVRYSRLPLADATKHFTQKNAVRLNIQLIERLSFLRLSRRRFLGLGDIFRLIALVSFSDIEFHLGTLFECSIALAANGSEVDKNIFTIWPFDKPKALRVIEPFDCT